MRRVLLAVLEVSFGATANAKGGQLSRNARRNDDVRKRDGLDNEPPWLPHDERPRTWAITLGRGARSRWRVAEWRNADPST